MGLPGAAARLARVGAVPDAVVYAPRVSRRLLLVLVAVTAAGCATGDDDGASVACSWSRDAGDAHQDDAAHICADDDGNVEAFHFQPGSRVTLQLRGGPRTLTVGENGQVETRVPTESGLVAVTGTKANGEPFLNELTLLPRSG